MNREFRLGSVLVVLAVLVLGRATPLDAHDTLVRSTPAVDTSLASLPTELRLTFSGSVTARLSRVVLLGPDSIEVALDSLRRHADSSQVLIAPIRGQLAAGRYTVAWQIAGADGHPVRGTFAFTILPEALPDPLVVGADTGAERTAPAGDPGERGVRDTQLPSRFDSGSPIYAAIRWLLFAGILGVIGAVGLEMLVLRRSVGPTGAGEVTGVASGRAARLGLLMAGLTAVATVLTLVAQSWALQATGGFDLAVMREVLFASQWGIGWIVGAASVVVAAVGLALAGRSETGWSLAAFGAIGLAVSLSLSGHTATAPRLPLLTIVLDALHVVAVGGWLGTLLALVVVGLPATLALPAERRGPATAAMVNAFSPAALVFAGIALLTGLFAIGIHLGVPPAFTSTAYGRTLLVKLGAFALVVVVGAWNWRRVRPRLTEPGLPTHLRRTGTTELLLAALVLAATAVLVATPPPGHE